MARRKFTCSDCPYCYKTEDDKYPCCQFGEPDWLNIPPCEEIDYIEEVLMRVYGEVYWR